MAKPIDNSLPATRLVPAIAFLLALCAFLSLFHDIYVDDAYITLAYARSFAASGTWGMHPGFVSNAATSPLDVLLLSGFIKLGFPGIWAVYAFECLLAVAIFCALSVHLAPRLSARIFGPISARSRCSPIRCSSRPPGWKPIFSSRYCSAAVIAYLAERYFLLGLAAGCLVLARPDGVLLLAPLFALMVWEKRGLDFVKVLIGFAIVVGAWGFVSWLYLGSAIPDTYFIKRKEAAWHDFSFANGLVLYYFKYPLATLLSLAPLVFVPFALPLARTNRDWRAFVVLAGGLALVHYAAYSLLNLPPYHWYYGFSSAHSR